ncbi:MAG: tetratricopeptide repeat protein [Thermoplasmata archaeon]
MGMLDSLFTKENKALSKVYKLLEEADRLYAQRDLQGETKSLYDAYMFIRNNYQELSQYKDKLVPAIDQIASKLIYHTQRYDIAIPTLELAINLQTNEPVVWLHYAIALSNYPDKLELALQAINKALSISVSKEGLDITGDILLKMGKKEEAINAYLKAQDLDTVGSVYIDKAYATDPNNIKVAEYKIKMLMKAGKIDDASFVLNTIINKYLDNADLWVLKSDIDDMRGYTDVAIASIDKAISISPDNPSYFVKKANLYIKRKKWEEASNNYNIALAKNPNIIEALEGKAICMSMLKNNTEVLNIRRRISTIDPSNINNWKQRMFVAKSLNVTEEVKLCAEAILRLNPTDSDAIKELDSLRKSSNISEINVSKEEVNVSEATKYVPYTTADVPKMEEELAQMKSQGNQEEVLKIAKNILANAPNNKTALIELGRGYILKGDIKNGLTYFDKYLSYYPDDEKIAIERITILSSTGQYEEAINALNAIISKKESSELWLLKGQTLVNYAEFSPANKERLYKEAEQAYDNGLRLYGPSVPKLLEEKANLYLIEGKYYDALSVYELISSTSTNNIVAIEGMAKCYYGLKNYNKVVETIDHALQISSDNAELWVMRGDSLTELGRYEDALNSYKEAIFQKGNDFNLIKKVFTLQIKINKKDEAIESINKLVELNKTPENLMLKGDLLMQLSKYDEAINVFNECITAKPDYIEAKIKIAECMDMGKKYKDLIPVCKDILKVDPKNIKILNIYSKALAEEGQYKESLNAIDSLLAIDSKNIEAITLKLNILKTLGDENEYQKTIDALIDLNPDDENVISTKVQFLLKNKKYDEAEEVLKKFLTLKPNNMFGLKKLLYIYKINKKWGSALNVANQILVQEPDSIEALETKALVLSETGKFDEAMTFINNELSKNPKNIALLVIGGNLLSSKSFRNEAEIYYHRALDVDPKNIEAFTGLAKLKMASNNLKGAKEIVLNSLNIDKNNVALLSMLGEINEQLGIITEAIDAYKKVLEKDEDNADISERLAELLKNSGKYEEALKYYDMALKSAPSKVDLLTGKVECLEKMKKDEEAIAVYDKLLEINKQDKFLWNNKGLTLLRLGKHKEALICFDNALSLDPKLQSAIEGKKVAEEKSVEEVVKEYSRKVLDIEFQTGRPLTKQEIFLKCGVPFNVLDKVVSYITGIDKIDVLSLSDKEIESYDGLSLELFKFFVQKKGVVVDPRNIKLSEITGYMPRLSTEDAKKLLAYIKGVMSLEDSQIPFLEGLDEYLRKALTLNRRHSDIVSLAVFLEMGILKARAIDKGLKVFEADNPNTQESQVAVAVAVQNTSPEEDVPIQQPGVPRPPPTLLEGGGNNETTVQTTVQEQPSLRCAVCGGPATVIHDCGTPLCDNCITLYNGNCPKCGLPVVRNISPGNTDQSKSSKRKKKNPVILKVAPGIISPGEKEK